MLIISAIFLFREKNIVEKYETDKYAEGFFQKELYSDHLCVVSENITYNKFQTDDEFHAAALLKLKDKEVLYAENMHERIYPASTTKILTTYLALKYGNMNDVVEVSENAANVPSDSSRAGLKQGDQLMLEDLLYALMLPSGNDAAVAVAEHISGSVDAFVGLMNQEAKKLGMTHSNFVNAHGYQDENHYTTAYDLYLVFHQCVQNEKFLEIVSSPNHTAQITESDGVVREDSWMQSNQFINGDTPVPDDIVVVGGKTGTTDEAGACLVLYATDSESNPYISIIMGAESKPVLYKNMKSLISTLQTEQ